jgi:hydroxylaminobenzene mutase
MGLFVLGLLAGLVVPLFTNSRAGLSAHLAGVQSGMFLLIAGAIWQRLALSAAARVAAYSLNLFGAYAIWVALMLAAAWGTSKSTPIAGAGFAGSPAQEWGVAVILGAGSIATLGAALLMLYGLVRSRVSS